MVRNSKKKNFFLGAVPTDIIEYTGNIDEAFMVLWMNHHTSRKDAYKIYKHCILLILEKIPILNTTTGYKLVFLLFKIVKNVILDTL